MLEVGWGSFWTADVYWVTCCCCCFNQNFEGTWSLVEAGSLLASAPLLSSSLVVVVLFLLGTSGGLRWLCVGCARRAQFRNLAGINIELIRLSGCESGARVSCLSAARQALLLLLLSQSIAALAHVCQCRWRPICWDRGSLVVSCWCWCEWFGYERLSVRAYAFDRCLHECKSVWM